MNFSNHDQQQVGEYIVDPAQIIKPNQTIVDHDWGKYLQKHLSTIDLTNYDSTKNTIHFWNLQQRKRIILIMDSGLNLNIDDNQHSEFSFRFTIDSDYSIKSLITPDEIQRNTYIATSWINSRELQLSDCLFYYCRYTGDIVVFDRFFFSIDQSINELIEEPDLEIRLIADRVIQSPFIAFQQELYNYCQSLFNQDNRQTIIDIQTMKRDAIQLPTQIINYLDFYKYLSAHAFLSGDNIEESASNAIYIWEREKNQKVILIFDNSIYLDIVPNPTHPSTNLNWVFCYNSDIATTQPVAITTYLGTILNITTALFNRKRWDLNDCQVYSCRYHQNKIIFHHLDLQETFLNENDLEQGRLFAHPNDLINLTAQDFFKQIPKKRYCHYQSFRPGEPINERTIFYGSYTKENYSFLAQDITIDPPMSYGAAQEIVNNAIKTQSQPTYQLDLDRIAQARAVYNIARAEIVKASPSSLGEIKFSDSMDLRIELPRNTNDNIFNLLQETIQQQIANAFGLPVDVFNQPISSSEKKAIIRTPLAIGLCQTIKQIYEIAIAYEYHIKDIDSDRLNQDSIKISRLQQDIKSINSSKHAEFQQKLTDYYGPEKQPLIDFFLELAIVLGEITELYQRRIDQGEIIPYQIESISSFFSHQMLEDTGIEPRLWDLLDHSYQLFDPNTLTKQDAQYIYELTSCWQCFYELMDLTAKVVDCPDMVPTKPAFNNQQIEIIQNAQTLCPDIWTEMIPNPNIYAHPSDYQVSCEDSNYQMIRCIYSSLVNINNIFHDWYPNLEDEQKQAYLKELQNYQDKLESEVFLNAGLDIIYANEEDIEAYIIPRFIYNLAHLIKRLIRILILLINNPLIIDEVQDITCQGADIKAMEMAIKAIKAIFTRKNLNQYPLIFRHFIQAYKYYLMYEMDVDIAFNVDKINRSWGLIRLIINQNPWIWNVVFPIENDQFKKTLTPEFEPWQQEMNAQAIAKINQFTNHGYHPTEVLNDETLFALTHRFILQEDRVMGKDSRQTEYTFDPSMTYGRAKELMNKYSNVKGDLWIEGEEDPASSFELLKQAEYIVNILVPQTYPQPKSTLKPVFNKRFTQYTDKSTYQELMALIPNIFNIADEEGADELDHHAEENVNSIKNWVGALTTIRINSRPRTAAENQRLKEANDSKKEELAIKRNNLDQVAQEHILVIKNQPKNRWDEINKYLLELKFYAEDKIGHYSWSNKTIGCQINIVLRNLEIKLSLSIDNTRQQLYQHLFYDLKQDDWCTKLRQMESDIIDFIRQANYINS